MIEENEIDKTIGSNEWISSIKDNIKLEIKLSKQLLKSIKSYLDTLSIEDLKSTFDEIQDIRIDIEGVLM